MVEDTQAFNVLLNQQLINQQQRAWEQASGLAGAPNWQSRPPGTPRYPDPPKLMDAKTCREKMRHMLRLDRPGARVFLACLNDRLDVWEV